MYFSYKYVQQLCHVIKMEGREHNCIISHTKMSNSFVTLKEWTALNTTVFLIITIFTGDRGGTVVKVLCYKSEGRWLDPSWCQWIFH